MSGDTERLDKLAAVADPAAYFLRAVRDVVTQIADASSGSVDRPAALDAVEVLFAAGWDLDDVRRFPILYRQLRDRVDWAGFSADGEHTPWLTPCEVAENIARVVNVWRGAGGR